MNSGGFFKITTWELFFFNKIPEFLMKPKFPSCVSVKICFVFVKIFELQKIAMTYHVGLNSVL